MQSFLSSEDNAHALNHRFNLCIIHHMCLNELRLETLGAARETEMEPFPSGPGAQMVAHEAHQILLVPLPP